MLGIADRFWGKVDRNGPLTIICVNGDGSVEKRSVGALLLRIVDFERGRVWSQQAFAVSESMAIPVYTEIPWSSYSSLTPKAQKAYEEECMRKKDVGGGVR